MSTHDAAGCTGFGGDSLFIILAANHLPLNYDESLPEAIVVGIAYGSFDEATRDSL